MSFFDPVFVAIQSYTLTGGGSTIFQPNYEWIEAIESPSREERMKQFDGHSISYWCSQNLTTALYICILYLVLTFGGQAIMKSRKAFDLRVALIMWNLLLSIFSALGAAVMIPTLLSQLLYGGVYYSICVDPVFRYGIGWPGLATMLFIMSKVPELFDTMFIVLRKKPLIFLHWYHHVSVLLFCFHAYADQVAYGIYFVAMNYSVHAIMYFYYALRAMGYNPNWASLVTSLQISQMVVGIVVCVVSWWFWTNGETCHVTAHNFYAAIIMYSSYFALFSWFAVERYIMPKKKGDKDAGKRVKRDQASSASSEKREKGKSKKAD